MIRSAPPASAHLAERPVPAPAPMIGLPGVDLRAQPRERLAACVMRRSCDQLVEPVRPSPSANAGSLTSRVELVHLDLRRVDELAQRREQRLVRLGVVERPAPRSRSPTRPSAGRRARSARSRRSACARRSAAELRALLRRRPHQRDRRVVDVEVPVRGLLAAPCRIGPKLTMSSAPSETTCGMPELARRLEPVGHRRRARRRRARRRARSSSRRATPTRKPPASERLHRLPPVPVAWKTSTS